MKELLESEGAGEKSVPLIAKIMIPLRNALSSVDKTIFSHALEGLRLLS